MGDGHTHTNTHSEKVEESIERGKILKGITETDFIIVYVWASLGVFLSCKLIYFCSVQVHTGTFYLYR